MPHTHESIAADATTEEEAAALLASREKFGAGFRRSQNGNLTQRVPHLDDPNRLVRLTVFRKWAKRFHWVMDDGTDRVRYSPRGGYELEEDAVSGLWREWLELV